MKCHIIRISREKTTYLTNYLRNGNENSEAWSDNVEDWREFEKKEAKKINYGFNSRGIDTSLEKDIGI